MRGRLQRAGRPHGTSAPGRHGSEQASGRAWTPDRAGAVTMGAMQATREPRQPPAGRHGGPAGGSRERRASARASRARAGGGAPRGRRGRAARLLAALSAVRRRGRRRRRSTCPRAAAAGRAGSRARSRASARRSASGGFQTLMLIMCASYLRRAGGARALPLRACSLRPIVAAHVILLLGPPLISQDVFGYLGVRAHGRAARARPLHARRRRSAGGRRSSRSSAGRSSTRPTARCSRSRATPPRRSGSAGGLWALKALARSRSLAAVALVARAARPARAARGAGRRRSSG